MHSSSASLANLSRNVSASAPDEYRRQARLICSTVGAMLWPVSFGEWVSSLERLALTIALAFMRVCLSRLAAVRCCTFASTQL